MYNLKSMEYDINLICDRLGRGEDVSKDMVDLFMPTVYKEIYNETKENDRFERWTNLSDMTESHLINTIKSTLKATYRKVDCLEELHRRKKQEKESQVINHSKRVLLTNGIPLIITIKSSGIIAVHYPNEMPKYVLPYTTSISLTPNIEEARTGMFGLESYVKRKEVFRQIVSIYESNLKPKNPVIKYLMTLVDGTKVVFTQDKEGAIEVNVGDQPSKWIYLPSRIDTVNNRLVDKREYGWVFPDDSAIVREEANSIVAMLNDIVKRTTKADSSPVRRMEGITCTAAPTIVPKTERIIWSRPFHGLVKFTVKLATNGKISVDIVVNGPVNSKIRSDFDKKMPKFWNSFEDAVNDVKSFVDKGSAKDRRALQKPKGISINNLLKGIDEA